MKSLKQIISYLINPRPNTWNFSDSDEIVGPRKIPWKGIFNPPLILGAIILIGLIIVVWFGPRLASYDPYLTSRSRPSYYDSERNMMIRPPFDPAPEYPLGTDRFGNDILSLILYGARATMISCFYITAGRVLLGLVLGGVSGWLEGSWLDRFIMRISVVISSIPLLLSAMLMILALDIHKGVWVFVVSLSVLGWTEIAQQVRAEVIRIKGMLYIEAAEALGLTRLQVFIRHALPNVLSHLVSLSFLEMGAVLLIMAELGFLKIFVGGASKFKSNPYTPVVSLLSKIPEWGALVAQGTPYLRGYPHMALGPTAAFFISILGLNAFGEGIRQIVDRWPISTAFLLRKRMLLAMGGFIGLTIAIFQMTSAAVSYQNLAESLQTERLEMIFEDLQKAGAYAYDSPDNPLVVYVSERFEDLGLKKGYSEVVTSTYYYPAETTVIRPLEEPQFLTNSSQEYHFQEDYAFLADGCAGSGSGKGQIVLFGGEGIDLAEMERSQIDGKIVLTSEDNYTPGFVEEAAKQGAEGILVVTQEQPPLTSDFEVSEEQGSRLCPVDTIPVFRITESVIAGIMEQAGLDWRQESAHFSNENPILNLEIQAVLDLSLSEPELVSVPNVIGFIGGFDMDHANEVLVVYTSYDGLGLTAYGQEGVSDTDLAKIALLLEILNTWKESQLDPRRSVQFVIWGGEGLEGTYSEMLTGIFEKNRMAAKVPTKAIRPAFWLEIRDLAQEAEKLAFVDGSTEFMVDLLKKAAQAGGIGISPVELGNRLPEIALPNLYLGEGSETANADVPDITTYLPRGVVINRVLIQLSRDMEIGKGE